MHVVTTAGHVDHGKSTLVRALTGADPDRLAEEKRRGLSIQLGYAWTRLPGVGDVAFVDVPGHERFIATTLSGLGPVSATLLVVAADDPWMPQTAEHLAALDALAVRHGIVVVTRADLADPAPALERARAEVARTSLRGAAEVVVSARTGVGLDELRAALASMLAALPAPDPAAPVRVWLDRSFHVRGAGTVVTGTLPAGTVAVGDTLEADPASGGGAVRVRGLETLGSAVTEVSGPARVALDLGGRAPEELRRGSALVTPGTHEATTVLDVRLRPAGGPAGPPAGDRQPPERPVLHVGATDVAVHARPLTGDGDLVRLTLPRALPLRIGDRAILRDPGSRALWGVEVLDPAPPPLRRRGAAARRAELLRRADGSLAAQVALRGVVRRSLLQRLGAADGPVEQSTVEAEDWLVAPGRAEELRRRLGEVVTAAATPADPGPTVEAAGQALGLREPGQAAAVVPRLVTPPLRLARGRVVAGPAEPELPARLTAAAQTLQRELADEPFAAPDAGRLTQLGLDPRSVATLHRAGRLLHVGQGIVLLPGADRLALERLRALPQPFTTSEARRALGTTRRVVLPLLGHLDRSGGTVRLTDDRRRVR